MDTCGKDTVTGGTCMRIPGHPGDCFDGMFYTAPNSVPFHPSWALVWELIKPEITLHRVLGLLAFLLVVIGQVSFDILAIANWR